ncbi:MAG TPA: zinc ribbon domain-containing protein, partial [Pyrinomonadaceae bacterium]|nr:zinc ribbon domain-containing protein [Pyrinomonadaceae bacterium]
MFCPQCGTDSAEGQHYCRSCGTNLKVIGRAVTLGDAISKTDGVPAKLKEIMSNVKIAQVTEEVSRAMEKMKTEIARSSADEWRDRQERRRQRRARREKTAEERRERHLTKGAIKFFTGGGLSIFLYVLFHSLQLRLPPDVVAATPFAIDPVVRSLWAFGFIPMLSGVGHIIAGLSIKPMPQRERELSEQAPLRIDQPIAPARIDPQSTTAAIRQPSSVTERTTNILDR